MVEKLIPVYYIYDSDYEEVTISGKDYVEYAECYADGANGENGVVYKRFKNEPYNYFHEINDAMWSLDHMENSESNFDITGCSIQQVINEMRSKGFEMIEDPNP